MKIAKLVIFAVSILVLTGINFSCSESDPNPGAMVGMDDDMSMNDDDPSEGDGNNDDDTNDGNNGDDSDDSTGLDPDLIGLWNVTLVGVEAFGLSEEVQDVGTLEFRQDGTGVEDYAFTAFDGALEVDEGDEFTWVSTAEEVTTDPGTGNELVWERLSSSSMEQVARFTIEVNGESAILTVTLTKEDGSNGDDSDDSTSLDPDLIGLWNVTLVGVEAFGLSEEVQDVGTLEFRQDGTGIEDYAFTAFDGALEVDEGDEFTWVSTAEEVTTDPGTGSELVWERISSSSMEQVARFTIEVNGETAILTVTLTKADGN